MPRNASIRVGTTPAVPIVGQGVASWALSEGTDPFSNTFVVKREDAKKLMSGGLQPGRITIGDQVFSSIYVLHEAPGPNPWLARVKCVDRRWFWNRKTLRAGYNVRRKIGVKRLTAPDAMSADVSQNITDRVVYAPYSLNDDTAWKAEDVLRDVMEVCNLGEQKGDAKVLFGKGVKEHLEKFPIENLIMDGPAKDGLAQLLSYFSGLGLCITASGAAKFYMKSDGSEAAMVTAAGPRKQDRGWIEAISLRRIRPSKIRVQFVRECELRFDFVEVAAGTTSAGRTKDARYMDNVLEIPDFSLIVEKETLSLGNWVTIDKALVAWGAPPGLQGLTIDFVRKAFVPFNSLFDVLSLVGIADADKDWAARAGALNRHYRQTYQINQAWLGRIFQLKPVRVGTFDVATGARAGATVFSDFAYLNTRRSAANNWGDVGNKAYIINVPGFGGGDITSAHKAAPSRLSIIDADQGILQVNFQIDRMRVFEKTLPSQVELEGQQTPAGTRPKSEPGVLGCDPRYNSLAFNMVGRGKKPPALTANYNMACILTAIPALGRKSRQFTVIEVTPDQVAPFKGSKECHGPVLDIMIGSGYETARIAWTDTLSSAMEEVFGVSTGQIPDDELNEALNKNTVNMSGASVADSGVGGSLNTIAKGAATRVWHALADREQGSMTGDLVPGLEPTGWLREVGYSIEPTGEMSVQLALPPSVPQLKLEQYLNATTRRIVLQLANPGG